MKDVCARALAVLCCGHLLPRALFGSGVRVQTTRATFRVHHSTNLVLHVQKNQSSLHSRSLTIFRRLFRPTKPVVVAGVDVSDRGNIRAELLCGVGETESVEEKPPLGFCACSLSGRVSFLLSVSHCFLALFFLFFCSPRSCPFRPRFCAF